MVKKINPISMFVFLLIAWIFIIVFIFIINTAFGFDHNSETSSAWIFWIFLMLPTYITNIIINRDRLNPFDPNYFWGIQPEINSHWMILFWLFAGLYFSFILTLLSGDKEKIKNIILKFHFGFFTYAIISRAVVSYFAFPESPQIKSGNFIVLLTNTIFIATNIYILTRIKKEVDFEFLKNTIKKYFLTISELLLTLYVALAFYNYLLAPDANSIDRVSAPLAYLVGGFFFFLCLRLIRIRFKEG